MINRGRADAAGTLTWLGQASFQLDVEGIRVLIDPFLSDHPARLYPPPDAVRTATGVDWLLVTHEHLDHFDQDFVRTLAAHSPAASIVLPTPLVAEAAALSPSARIVGVQPGDRVELTPTVHVLVTPATHAVEAADGYSAGRGADGLARFVGYVVKTPHVTLYHSGDTLVTDELRAALAGESIDVALLPVNGRDYYREAAGLAGNMDAHEAAELAKELGVGVLVPMHWDLFAGNTISPGRAVDEAAAEPAVHVLTLARSVPWRLPARSTGGR